MVWNYTTLKLFLPPNRHPRRFTTLWNYTTLKPGVTARIKTNSFTTLWNYTTLKLFPCAWWLCQSFTTLWNYTTLKQARCFLTCLWVLLPYEITLLSNCPNNYKNNYLFYYIMKLHYSQTRPTVDACRGGFTTLWNYTTLKQAPPCFRANAGFTTLWNYTTLKPCSFLCGYVWVLLPYKITLLSNGNSCRL